MFAFLFTKASLENEKRCALKGKKMLHKGKVFPLLRGKVQFTLLHISLRLFIITPTTNYDEVK